MALQSGGGEGDCFTVEMEGGRPWGFTLQGGLDFRSPLRIGKVTPGGKASRCGLIPGDFIVSINGTSSKSLKHLQAQQLIVSCTHQLVLQCTKVVFGITSPLTHSNSFSWKTAASTHPPAPTTQQPAPTTHQPAPTTQQPAPTTQQPAPTTQQPAPTTRQPTPPVANSISEEKPTPVSAVQAASPPPAGAPSSEDGTCTSAMLENGHDSHSDKSKDHDAELVDEQLLPAEPEATMQESTAMEQTPSDDSLENGKEGSASSGEDNGELEPFEVDISEWAVVEMPTSAQMKEEQELDNNHVLSDDQDKALEGDSPQDKAASPSQDHTLQDQSQGMNGDYRSPEPVEAEIAVSVQGPGWYKDMFHGLQKTTTRRASEGELDDDSVEYDYRGLRVRRGSKKSLQDNKPSNSATHKGFGVTTTEEVVAESRRPTTYKSSSGLHGKLEQSRQYWQEKEKEEKVIEQQRRNSREFYVKRRRSSSNTSTDRSSPDQPAHVTSTAPSITPSTQPTSTSTITPPSPKQSSPTHPSPPSTHHAQAADPAPVMSDGGYSVRENLHPILVEEDVTPSDEAGQVDQKERDSVFERIEADKLQGALTNAVQMGKMEQMGVPSTMMPVMSAEQRDAENAKAEARKKQKKSLQPPPGPKAKALFTFSGKSEKELSFKKGDVIDLTHSVDQNWLEGKLGDSKGIFPKAYVKVLQVSSEAVEQTAEKPQLLKAKGRFDFSGQSERELSFKRDDMLLISKKIDSNWYEGFHDERKGIFPIAYVQLIQEDNQ